MKDTEKAFLWITDILEKRGIEYRISGGFAARLYGSDRELADIDIEIVETDIPKIVSDVQPYITFGPDRYTDENWDLVLMTLVYEGQEIDLAATGALIFNQRTKEWEEYKADLKDVEYRDVYGKQVPIEPLESLVMYKKKLGREVDRNDVENLQKI